MSYTLHQFAGDVATAAKQIESGGIQAFRAALHDPVRQIVARTDLLENAMPRAGNNVAESWFLYFDGNMSIVLFKVPQAPAVQPHDHGIWETLFVYRGKIRHTVYQRADDGSQLGRAHLMEVDSALLGPGEFALVAPPKDIHGFHAVEDDTYGITVSMGAYKPERLYFDLSAGSYEVRRPRTLR